MFNFHQKETPGRSVPKPVDKSVKDEVEFYEEAVPITQQIENLRTKIALQERYNAALKDNLEESTKGSYQVLRNMFNEIYTLRLQLKEAINQEKWAVNNALRTHRIFQLSLRYASPTAAIEWMDDKLFDNAKVLNGYIDRLIKKRKKLRETETAVEMLEKYPVPGSLPWEVRLAEKQRQTEVNQANVQLKLECAREMRNKYRMIRWRLRLEKDLYAPIIRNLTSQLNSQQAELTHLQEMLADAQKFQRDAEESLEWTEAEASTNRKQRRAQIAKMRKEMQKIVAEEHLSLLDSKPSYEKRVSNDSTGDRGAFYSYQSILARDDAEQEQTERLALKRSQISSFNDNAALLVDLMKIPNLTHIPGRMDDVIKLNAILKEETKSKHKLKDVLIRQRDQLTQLFCVIRYTGNNEIQQNNLVLSDYQNNLKELKEAIERERNRLNKDASLIYDLQLGIATLTQRIEGMDKKPVHIQNTDHLFYILQSFHEKLKALCDTLTELRKETMNLRFKSVATMRPKPQIFNTPARFVRVGDPIVLEEGSDEEDFDDFRVPGREDLKLQSEKILNQGLLRLGFAAARRKQTNSRYRSNHKPSDDEKQRSSIGGEVDSNNDKE